MDDPFEQARAHFFAALGRQEAGDLGEAERLYRASLDLVPGRASTLINLAAVQLRFCSIDRGGSFVVNLSRRFTHHSIDGCFDDFVRRCKMPKLDL